jgi:hypothetical protein
MATIVLTDVAAGGVATPSAGQTTIFTDNSVLKLKDDTGNIIVPGGGVASVGVTSTDLLVSGSPITSIGDITLNLKTVPVSKGGTGLTSIAAGFLQSDGSVLSSATLTNAQVVTAIGYTPLNKAGDTMTGNLILNADPSTNLGAATKQYVDNYVSGLNVHAPVTAATTATLAGTVTYNNGSSGVGATLSAAGSLPTFDTISLSLGQRVLIKNEINENWNGIYDVTTLSGPWVLTRSTDFDNSPSGEVVAGDSVYVQSGAQNAGRTYVMTSPGTIAVGTSSIVFTQLSGPGVYVGGNGIVVDNANVISNTGVTATVAGSGISVSGTTGSVTISNTGVVSVTGTQIQVSSTSGAVTLSLANSFTVTGTITATSMVVGDVEVGYKWIPQVSTAISYTATNADSGKHILNAATNTAVTFTIPANSSVAFPLGTAITFVNPFGGSTATIVCSDTMRLAPGGTTGTRTLAASGIATAMKVGTSSWLISGAGLS